MNDAVLREVVASLYEDTPDAVVLYDHEGNLVAANESARALAGYEMSSFVGESFRRHVPARDLPRIEVAMQTALGGGTDHFDTTVRHRDGDLIPVECYVFPAKLKGETIGVFVQARDLVALRSAEESLSVNQQKFRSLFEYHPDGIMEIKHAGTISRVNVALESETGFYGEQMVGKPWTELIAPEYRDRADNAMHRAMRGEAIELDSLLLDRFGNRIDVQLKFVPLHVGREIRGAYAIFKNIVAQKRAEREIATQSDRIRRLYLAAALRGRSVDHEIEATLSLGLELFGFDQGYVKCIEGEHVHVRYAVGEGAVQAGIVYPLQSTLARHLNDDCPELFIEDMNAPEWVNDPARAGSPWRSYFALRLVIDGKPYGVLAFAGRRPRVDGMDQRDRDLLQLMGLFVTAAIERAEQKARIEQLAFNDALTGLPNRVLFNDRILQTLATAKRYGRDFAVMYADLDNFKAINDGFGHATGDAVLQRVAERLRSVVRESDTVARFGGDEFVILQPIVEVETDAADLARKLNFAMQEPVVIDGVSHSVHISVGIALYPSDATTIEGLMEAADRALYTAKREGRNRWCFADADAARSGFNARAASRREAAE